MTGKKVKEPEEEAEESGEVELVEVTATTQPGYRLPDGSIVTPEQYLAWIGQKIDHISKNIG